MKPKKITFSLILILLITIGITFGIVHQNQVKAERIAQERRKTEDKNLKVATAAITIAYQTRADQDIKKAETALSKLSKHQKTEQTKLTTKLTQLKGFLKQISNVNDSLAKATQSKSEQDIKATQALINQETNDYLKTDQATAQNKLNALIALIAKEKAEADAKSKSEAQAQQAASEASQQADHTTEVSDYQTYVEAPQGAYQTSDRANSTLVPQQNYQTPAQNSDNNGNASGITDSPGGTDGYQPWGEWQSSNGNASGITDSPGGWDTPNNSGIVWDH
ncbi:hypothetical protein DIY07_01600 [Streptococcus iniae]|uniref:Uncharacterized protein n=1 Tax=Streptococcus iniae TaxID=1346 RepID=A0A3L8GP89_STRIN|nr:MULTISPECIES: hypothetical protein [Streptococcaceae]QIW56805.1 hypothetical protein GU335_09580 [Lactococcus raffinolactis]RLU56097.1 hypothetical protein DIY09_01625 [Streptococcus iniae]RLU58759.1 hypothetical protein DIY07_01600 [Streptococcus iniae]